MNRNNRNQLIASLYSVSKASLASANKGNPFISKADAMKDINQVRKLARDTHTG